MGTCNVMQQGLVETRVLKSHNMRLGQGRDPIIPEEEFGALVGLWGNIITRHHQLAAQTIEFIFGLFWRL